jgi:plastocyanin
MMRARLRLIAASAALFAAVAFASEPKGGGPAEGTVLIKDFSFSPAELVVSRGTRVTWKNMDGEPHTIASTAGAFRSGALDEEDTFSFQFDQPGTYRYVCTIHPHMSGTITVR